MNCLQSCLRLLVLLLMATTGFISARAQQISLTSNHSAIELARRIVGGGVYVYNAQYKGRPASNGIFEAAAGTLGLRSGIVLSTGRVLTSGTDYGIDAPASANATNSMGGPADADLSTYSGKVTVDASVLEFDFIPAGDSISVNFVFASEEYPFFNCSPFNDAFAFLISGPGFTGRQNIALVPGTGYPIAINTINDGSLSTQGDKVYCTAISPQAPYTQYYQNNSNSPTIVYNGMTKRMTARAKVTPCVAYHIKLVVADAGNTADDRLDSGVFIEANSFKSDGVQLEKGEGFYTEDSSLLLVEGCRNGTVKLVRPPGLANDPATVTLLYRGTALNGVDYATLPTTVAFVPGEQTKTLNIVPIVDNLNEGTETLKIYIRQSQCNNFYADSITVYLKDSASFTQTSDKPLCSAFPTLLQARRVTNVSNNYTWSTGANTAAISTSQAGTYWVMNRFASNCYNIDTFLLRNQDPVVNLGADRILCEGQRLELDGGNPGSSYLWHNGLRVRTITLIRSEKAWVQVTNAAGCVMSDTMLATFKRLPVVRLGNDTSLCTYDTIVVGAISEPGVTYRWSNGSTGSAIRAFAPNNYSLETELAGCAVRDSISLFSKRMPVARAGQGLLIAEGGAAKLQAQRAANNARYLWSPPQHLNRADIYNPIAKPPVTTTFRLRVWSQDSCVLGDSLTIAIVPTLNIPNVFSPNGDGINDTWRIDKLASHIYADVQIFDRYGQLVFSTLGYDKPWDGTVGGRPVPTDTYYYVIRIDPNRPPERGFVVVVR